MNRREIIVGIGGAALAWPLAARAQQPANHARIGYLSPGSAGAGQGQIDCFVAGLRDLGWIDGKTMSIEYRYAEGALDRYRPLATELVGLNLELIVASGTPGAQAVQQATRTIPVVFVAVSDPVTSQIVHSIGRPGGNITGVSNFLPATTGKLLELLKAATPNASRFCVLFNPDNPGKVLEVHELDVAGKALAAPIVRVEVRSSDDIEVAFAKIEQAQCNGLVVLQEGVMFPNRTRIAQFAEKKRIPSIYQIREYTDAGGLMSYGLNYCQHFRRAASYVDRILKGDKPSDLPVELPTTFELIINLKTAEALGLTIPTPLLVHADETIE